MNKKFYTCTTSWSQDLKFKIYSSISELKQNESCWAECGIYELTITASRCVVDPCTLFDIEPTDLDIKATNRQEICDEETTEAPNGFVGNIIQHFKKKKETDWTDLNGDKEFKWTGTCDACGCRKSNLTVIHSATLSGVTICQECRAKTNRGKNE